MRRNVERYRPVSERGGTEYGLSGDAVELHTLVQPIACVYYDISIRGAEPGETWRQQVILTLWSKNNTTIM